MNNFLIGIAPYMALELATFDILPQDMSAYLRGFLAAFIATAAFYPLDTIRRQIQIESNMNQTIISISKAIMEKEGIQGFYRGYWSNALKNLPNKGIRLGIFEFAKQKIKKSEAMYQEFNLNNVSIL